MSMAEATGQRALKRIFINGRFLTQRITGVQRYARETLLCLDDLLVEGEGRFARWVLLVPPGTAAPVLRHIAVQQVGRMGGHLWEQIELAWHARDGFLMNFGLTGPMVKTNQVITVHDAAVVRMPQVYGWRFRAWYRLVVGIVGVRAPRVLTISHFSAAEAAECFGIGRDRLRVITLGWQHLDRVSADESILDRYGLRSKPFALAVSSPTPNKNFGIIAKALGLMGPAAPLCVAVGAANITIFKPTEASDALLRVGYVSDGELKALYQYATCFIFPSFYEGFGIPALEAMACGCPVIASTAPAVRETCGGEALYFDPTQPTELASCLRSLFASPSQQAQMRTRGIARAKLFSWRKSAILILATLHEVVAIAAKIR